MEHPKARHLRLVTSPEPTQKTDWAAVESAEAQANKIEIRRNLDLLPRASYEYTARRLQASMRLGDRATAAGIMANVLWWKGDSYEPLPWYIVGANRRDNTVRLLLANPTPTGTNYEPGMTVGMVKSTAWYGHRGRLERRQEVLEATLPAQEDYAVTAQTPGILRTGHTALSYLFEGDDNVDFKATQYMRVQRPPYNDQDVGCSSSDAVIARYQVFTYLMYLKQQLGSE
ncbi:MAG: hypothetical protein JWN38_607 [Candidatus Saccharibacteria bacterium]|nr:hypothetical protein [Candidatus Saccharibacteria bacterium]